MDPLLLNLEALDVPKFLARPFKDFKIIDLKNDREQLSD